MGIVIDLKAYRRARAAPSWRAMAMDDIGAVATLAIVLDPRGDLSEGTLLRAMACEPDGCLVLDAGGSVAGYAVGRTEVRNGVTVFTVDDVGVRPDLRDKGHGSAVVTRLGAHAAAMGARALAAFARRGSEVFWSRQGLALTDAPAGSAGSAGSADGRLMARIIPPLSLPPARPAVLQITHQG